jgi:uracil-DNA glycosylase
VAQRAAAPAGARPGAPPPRPAPSASSRPQPSSSPAGPALDPHGGLFGVAPSGWEQYRSLADLAAFCADCTRCGLAAGRQNVVFGSGDPDADLMFIGEGPGAEEDRQGLPFVGPAGELLGKVIEAIGLTRDRVYIANIVKCRPPGNRDPLPDEVAACRGYLERQIDLVRPRAIVALGRVAAQTLLESELPLSRLRGRWHSVRGVAVRATYHPAALLRNASWKRPTWEDMKLVKARLEEA